MDKTPKARTLRGKGKMDLESMQQRGHLRGNRKRDQKSMQDTKTGRGGGEEGSPVDAGR